ncbi:MAG TPA: tetraacyldisaccharide 4'-kinase [Geminicoccaceae bacterium]|nr:tetraacyldisaccharide 4'-kinase [Geminicoccus sp.]HMU49179.1 tetraacyldisaccharide 4'-kinase [Geminicoccaceae bacterium]
MREPGFWRRDGPAARLLQPLASLYALAARHRAAAIVPERLAVPVVGVGGVTVGGSGKTPVARAVAGLLREAGCCPHVVLRGYGGRLGGPVRVDAARHDAAMVGDEALLHAADGPAWVARRRAAGARAALAAGADCIVLDDALQHPGLAPALTLLVVDGRDGIGNGRTLPAGPLRESWHDALAKVDAVVLLGEDEAGMARRCGGTPVLRASIEPRGDVRGLEGSRLLAFAGIAGPGRFRRSLERLGAEVVRLVAFADHHAFRERELARLDAAARRQGLALVTTAKDAMRLPQHWRARVRVLEIAVVWHDPLSIRRLLRVS